MAAPVKYGTGPYAYGIGALTPALPAGTLPGMVAFMPVESSAGEATASSGWTAVTDTPVNNPNGTRLSLFWRRLTGSGDSPTVLDSGDHQSARIIVYNGVLGVGTPYEAQNATFGDGTAVSLDGETTLGVDRTILGFLSHDKDTLSELFSGFANADLTSVTEEFDNSSDVGNGGGIACFSGVKAVAGAFGASTATVSEAVAWAGIVLALIPGDLVEESSEEEGSSSEESSEEDNEVPYGGDGLGIDTWQFDTVEDDPADRDPIESYVAFQFMDNGGESRNKLISAIRLTGKFGDPEVQIHAASPGDTIDIEDVEDGTNARVSVPFADSTEITRYERKKVQAKNLSMWTARVGWTWDGLGDPDRLDELIIEGRTHGTEK